MMPQSLLLPTKCRVLFLLTISFIFTFLLLSPLVNAKLFELTQQVEVQTDNSQQSVENTSETQQIMLGAFYSLENDLQAKLLLNNKDPNPKEVRPTIYNLAGQSLELPPVTVEGMSFRFVDLRDWASIGGVSFRQGSIRLIYAGKDLAVGAQIYLTDETRSLSFEEKLQNVGGFDSRQLEGVWFQPSNQTETRIILSNASNSNLTVTARLSKRPQHGGDLQNFELAPHQTRVLRLREDFADGNQFANSEAVGISLSHSGEKSALIARAMVGDTGRGYSQVVPFVNPRAAKSARLDGAGLHLENVQGERLVPVVVVRNVGNTETTVSAQVPYTRESDTRSTVNLPAIRLRAGEIKLLDVRDVVQRATTEQIKTAGIEIDTTVRRAASSRKCKVSAVIVIKYFALCCGMLKRNVVRRAVIRF